MPIFSYLTQDTLPYSLRGGTACLGWRVAAAYMGRRAGGKVFEQLAVLFFVSSILGSLDRIYGAAPSRQLGFLVPRGLVEYMALAGAPASSQLGCQVPSPDHLALCECHQLLLWALLLAGLSLCTTTGQSMILSSALCFHWPARFSLLPLCTSPCKVLHFDRSSISR